MADVFEDYGPLVFRSSVTRPSTVQYVLYCSSGMCLSLAQTSAEEIPTPGFDNVTPSASLTTHKYKLAQYPDTVLCSSAQL